MMDLVKLLEYFPCFLNGEEKLKATEERETMAAMKDKSSSLSELSGRP